MVDRLKRTLVLKCSLYFIANIIHVHSPVAQMVAPGTLLVLGPRFESGQQQTSLFFKFYSSLLVERLIDLLLMDEKLLGGLLGRFSALKKYNLKGLSSP